MEEIWKSVKGYEGLYEVSNYGNVKSLAKSNRYYERLLKLSKDESGLRASLTINGINKPTYVHFLVAENFLENTNNAIKIKHKDGNKCNNHVSNLEWFTPPIIISSNEPYVHKFDNNGLIEEWKPIIGFEGYYEISTYGQIRSLDRILYNPGNGKPFISRGKILKLRNHNFGYLMILLSDGRRRKQYLVHRLVATTFIENVKNLREVNHKDFNKHNNRVDNLEWVSSSDNKRYSGKHGKIKCIKVRCVELDLIAYSMSEMARLLESKGWLKIKSANIGDYFRGKVSHVKGLTFQKIEE